ncbi:MAG: adenosine deaminase family protein [Candidatus Euphemobacter frigidus]|nr:adenosine deaminase family protein [Candidatus Euphemobacter frigidus]MDP8274823.1 adenosine deaminase family protein [Candidatus Euphemobacter frigidus]
MITKKFIEAVPKTDLHVHLDGSLRLSTLIDIAKQEKFELPSYTEEGLNELVFKDNYADLEEYLAGFQYTVKAMQTPENLERIAYEFAQDNQAEGVRYVEVRFAPQLHVNSRMDLENVLTSVNRGMERAAKEYNARPAITSGEEPLFIYGIITCALRFFGRRMSEYYRIFLDAHPFSDQRRNFGVASYELVQGVVQVRNRLSLPIVGFDLAGPEYGFPADDHWKAFHFAQKNFLHKTVHAGEAYGPESIFQAITDLYAERLGHGYYLFDESKITNPEIKDRKKYIQNLSQYIADRRITIEVCLTSNLQTNPLIGDIANHQFKKMKEAKLSATFCTDNRLMSKTTVTREIGRAVNAFAIDPKELKNHIIYGFKRCFYPGKYTEKRRYVRTIIDYYEELEREFGLFYPSI